MANNNDDDQKKVTKLLEDAHGGERQALEALRQPRQFVVVRREQAAARQPVVDRLEHPQAIASPS